MNYGQDNPITGLVAENIIDFFKVVDIQHQQGERGFANGVFFDKFVDVPIEGFAVINPGHTVSERFCAGFFQFNAQVVDLFGQHFQFGAVLILLIF